VFFLERFVHCWLYVLNRKQLSFFANHYVATKLPQLPDCDVCKKERNIFQHENKFNCAYRQTVKVACAYMISEISAFHGQVAFEISPINGGGLTE
jgi:hypothetical protein